MKRFYLDSDLRFEAPIEYKEYRGYVRKNQKFKYLLLIVPSINKEGKLLYLKKLQLVKLLNENVVG